MDALARCFLGGKKGVGTLLTTFLLFLGAFYFTAFTGAAMADLPHPVSGGIFTTEFDGTVVNGNTKYQFKEDVYLDGGPPPNAPAFAAGLPEGDYYFQVTDPSGKDLLSSDNINCRRVHVNEFGVIVAADSRRLLAFNGH